MIQNKYYRKECFKCNDCDKFLENEYFLKDDKFSCVDCITKNQKTCAACDKPIYDEYIFALDKYFMEECFNCILCKKKLGETTVIILIIKYYFKKF